MSLAHVALDARNGSMARSFIESGCSPDSRDLCGRTVLWRAVENHDNELIETCLEYSADLTLKMPGVETTLLTLSLETNQPEVTARLLEKDAGGNHELTTRHGAATLWRSVELALPLAARACMRHGVDATKVDANTGHTLLHVALLAGVPELLCDLIRHGACATMPDSLGRTPLILAAATGDLVTADFLLNAGAKPKGGPFGEDVAYAIEAKAFTVAERLIQSCPPSLPSKKAQGKTCRRSRMSQQSRENLPTTGGRFLPNQCFQEALDAKSVLQLAADAEAFGVVKAGLSSMLHAIGLRAADVRTLAESLCQWISSDRSGAGQRAVNAEEALACIVVDREPAASAKKALSLGVPDEIVEMAREMLSHSGEASPRFGDLVSRTPTPPAAA
eukprot:CAMPEP_0117584256 /NCGR_PEP_ID=MMETSP0784-20121206/67491_1 /TAXON_ID=39447 /ORGANISM="" /LENGTH=389 /DNA_ID=CAMNT_0005385077 /DNA_START=1 /DNA_END=1170 /DNA_ORIENTATION=-